MGPLRKTWRKPREAARGTSPPPVSQRDSELNFVSLVFPQLREEEVGGAEDRVPW